MKVYLDMDGVLVNFRKGIHDAFNISYDYSTLSDKWKFWEDWPDVTFNMVNAVCTTEFWQNLEWMHDGLELFKAVLMKFPSDEADIYLLTTPMPNLESATGKALWVDQYVPIFNKRLIITRTSKSLLAGLDTLLIDDKDKNVEEFVEAGGQGILVPRSWNSLHNWASETLQVVKNSLKEL